MWTFRHRWTTCEISSSRLRRTFTPPLKVILDYACAAETKTTGRCWQPRSLWHAESGPKMSIFLVLASRCGPQIASRFFSKRKYKDLNLGRSEPSDAYSRSVCARLFRPLLTIRRRMGMSSSQFNSRETKGKWLAQGDDFRTFLAEFVSRVPQVGLPIADGMAKLCQESSV